MAGRKIKAKGNKKLKEKRVNKSRKIKGVSKGFQSSTLTSKSGNEENACMICGGETYDVHCKRICKNCGYMRDCSDP